MQVSISYALNYLNLSHGLKKASMKEGLQKRGNNRYPEPGRMTRITVHKCLCLHQTAILSSHSHKNQMPPAPCGSPSLWGRCHTQEGMVFKLPGGRLKKLRLSVAECFHHSAVKLQIITLQRKECHCGGEGKGGAQGSATVMFYLTFFLTLLLVMLSPYTHTAHSSASD